MKIVHSVICVLEIALLTSCRPMLPQLNKADSTVVLTLECSQDSIYSIDELQCHVYLLNQSGSNILVHTRLLCMPYPTPPSLAELSLSMTDASGTYIQFQGHARYQLPDADTLGVLKVGEQITKVVYPSEWFQDNMFTKGEKYTIGVIYQNEFDVTQTIDGVEVSSWIGSIQSNEVTFTILP